MLRRITAIFISFCLLFEQSGFAQIAGPLVLPAFVGETACADTFRPAHLRSISYEPLESNFKTILDKGSLKEKDPLKLKDSTRQLFNYFLVGLSLPDGSFWVNLRPDSPDNTIDEYLAKTDIGKVMLEADVQLKKDTAKYTSPDTSSGRAYWDKLYRKAQELFENENINIPTLTRPWIVPDEIIIRQAKDNAYIYKATLKVMLEADYLSPSVDNPKAGKDLQTYSFDDPRLKALNDYSSQLIRDLVLPKLTRDVNISKRYAPLRQVYFSLILAQWFKHKYQNYTSGENLYTEKIDSRDLTNLVSRIKWDKDTYFQEYRKSFKNGEYNKQENVQTVYGVSLRQYFSGGVRFGGIAAAIEPGNIITANKLLEFLPGNVEQEVVKVVKDGPLGIEKITGASQPGGLPIVEDQNLPFAGAPVLNSKDGGTIQIKEKFNLLNEEEKNELNLRLRKLHQAALNRAGKLKDKDTDPQFYTITIREQRRFISVFLDKFAAGVMLPKKERTFISQLKGKVFKDNAYKADQERKRVFENAWNEASTIYLDMFGKKAGRIIVPGGVAQIHADAYSKLESCLATDISTLFLCPLATLDGLNGALELYRRNNPAVSVETIIGTPDTDRMQLIGAEMPVAPQDRKFAGEVIRFQKGVLYRLVDLAKANSRKIYVLRLEQVEALSAKVWVQLNQFLLTGELWVPETGEKLVMPDNLKIVASLSTGLKDSAFYDRFLRKQLEIPDEQSLGEYACQRFGLPEELVWEFLEIQKDNSENISEGQLLVLFSYIKGRLDDEKEAVDSERAKEIVREERDLFFSNAGRDNKRILLGIDKLVKSEPREIELTEELQFEARKYATDIELRSSHTGSFISQDEINSILKKYPDDWKDKIRKLAGIKDDFDNFKEISSERKGPLVREAMRDKDKFCMLLFDLDADCYVTLKELEGLDSDRYKVNFTLEEAVRVLVFANNDFGSILERDGIEGLDRLIDMRAAFKTVITIDPVTSHKVVFEPAAGRFLVDGVELPIRQDLKDKISQAMKTRDMEQAIKMVMKDELGLTLTRDVAKALSAIARNYRYGTKVLRLEGPTGTGKTYIAQVLAKMLDIPFYGEPFHAASKQSKLLGALKPDQKGDYSMDTDTPFLSLLENGGVIALSELNAAVKNDKARFGWLMVPFARGDKKFILNQYPADGNSSKELIRNPESMIIIDTNPTETYEARGELPGELKAFTPSVWVDGRFEPGELQEITGDFLPGLPEEERKFYSDKLAELHFAIQEELRGAGGSWQAQYDPKTNKQKDIDEDAAYIKSFSADSPHIISLRELRRACKMISGNNGKENKEQILFEAVMLYYGFAFKDQQDQVKVADFIAKMLFPPEKKTVPDGPSAAAGTNTPAATNQATGRERGPLDNLRGIGQRVVNVSGVPVVIDNGPGGTGVNQSIKLKPFLRSSGVKDDLVKEQNWNPDLAQHGVDTSDSKELMELKPLGVNELEQLLNNLPPIAPDLAQQVAESLKGYTDVPLPFGGIVQHGMDTFNSLVNMREIHSKELEALKAAISPGDAAKDDKAVPTVSNDPDTGGNAVAPGTVPDPDIQRFQDKGLDYYLEYSVLHTLEPTLLSTAANLDPMAELCQVAGKRGNVVIEKLNTNMFTDDFTLFGGYIPDAEQEARTGEKQFRLADGVMARFIKEAQKAQEEDKDLPGEQRRIFILALENYHYLRPQIAVALNAILQERVYYPPAGKEEIKLPDNLRFFATSSNEAEFELSLAEQSRWVRIFTYSRVNPGVSFSEQADGDVNGDTAFNSPLNKLRGSSIGNTRSGMVPTTTGAAKGLFNLIKGGLHITALSNGSGHGNVSDSLSSTTTGMLFGVSLIREELKNAPEDNTRMEKKAPGEAPIPVQFDLNNGYPESVVGGKAVTDVNGNRMVDIASIYAEITRRYGHNNLSGSVPSVLPIMNSLTSGGPATGHISLKSILQQTINELEALDLEFRPFPGDVMNTSGMDDFLREIAEKPSPGKLDKDTTYRSAEELRKGYLIEDSERQQEPKPEEELLVPTAELLSQEGQMVNAMNAGRVIIAEGEPGGGKTDMAIDIAERVGLNSYIYSGHAGAHLQDFIGTYTKDETGRFGLTCLPDKNGHFKVPFLEFYTHGGVLVFDEGAIGKRSQALISWLTGIARGEQELVINEHPGQEPLRLKRNKHFHIIITTNPVDDTPGRETIPVEVLKNSRRIRVESNLGDESYRSILNSFYRYYCSQSGVEAPAKQEVLINLQIALHKLMQEFVRDEASIDNPEQHLFTMRDMRAWVKAFMLGPWEEKTVKDAFMDSFELLYIKQFSSEAHDLAKAMVDDLLFEPQFRGVLVEAGKEVRSLRYAASEVVKTTPVRLVNGGQSVLASALPVEEKTSIVQDVDKVWVTETTVVAEDARRKTLQELLYSLRLSDPGKIVGSFRGIEVLKNVSQTPVIVAADAGLVAIFRENSPGVFELTQMLDLTNLEIKGMNAFSDEKGLLTIAVIAPGVIVLQKETAPGVFESKKIIIKGHITAFKAIRDAQGGLVLAAGREKGMISLYREKDGFVRKDLMVGINDPIRHIDLLEDEKGLLTITAGTENAEIENRVVIAKEKNPDEFDIQEVWNTVRYLTSVRTMRDNRGKLTIVTGAMYVGLENLDDPQAPANAVTILRELDDGRFEESRLEGAVYGRADAMMDENGFLSIVSFDQTGKGFSAGTGGVKSIPAPEEIAMLQETSRGEFSRKIVKRPNKDDETNAIRIFRDPDGSLSFVSGHHGAIHIWKDDEDEFKWGRVVEPVKQINDIQNEFVQKGLTIQSEEEVKSELARIFAFGSHGLLLMEPGARERQIISDFGRDNGYRILHLESNPEMTDMDILGGLFPILADEPRVNGNEFRTKPGFLTRHLVPIEQKDQVGEKKLLVLHNIDALPERVRAALNNFLIKGYLEVKDDSGRSNKFYLPAGTDIVATISAKSQREFSSAFFNRFVKLYVPSVSVFNEGFSELMQLLIFKYGLSEYESRQVQKIYLMVKALEQGGQFWPSGNDYSFTVKDALLLGEFVKLAKAEAGKRLSREDAQKLIVKETLRVYGGRLCEHEQDYNNFVDIILRNIFSHQLVEELFGDVKQTDGSLSAFAGVALPANGLKWEDTDPRYRLTLVPSITRTMSGILRGWQAGKMVSIVGETGVAKTTMGVFLSQILFGGQNAQEHYYIYSTHGESKARDMTVQLRMNSEGAFRLEIQDFLKRVQQGNQVLIVDEANMRPEMLWVLNALARGEKEITVEIPGEEQFTVKAGENVFVLLTMNPESYTDRGEVPGVLLENVFRLWAPAAYKEDEIIRILNDLIAAAETKAIQKNISFAGAQADLSKAQLKVTIETMLQNIKTHGHDQGIKMLTLKELRQLEGDILALDSVREKMGKIRSAVAIMAPEAKLVFSMVTWWSMTMDGKVINVPLYELVNPKRSLNATIGLILHEIRHKRFSATKEELEDIAASLDVVGMKDTSQVHHLWNTIDDLRIDGIKEISQGENDYIDAMNHEFFDDGDDPESDKRELSVALTAPHSVFDRELILYGYTGRFSAVFPQLPEDLRKDILKVAQNVPAASSPLYRATRDAKVVPDLEGIQQGVKNSKSERMRAIKESFKVLAEEIYPVYEKFLKQSREKEGEQGNKPGQGPGQGPEGSTGDSGFGAGIPRFFVLSQEELRDLIENTPIGALPQGLGGAQGMPSNGQIDQDGNGSGNGIPGSVAPQFMNDEERSQEQGNGLDNIINDAKTRRSEEMENNEPLNYRLSHVSKPGKRLADGLVQLFRVPDEPAVEESSSGWKINPVRYLVRHPEPFDVDVDVLGKPDLALGVTIDVSGSMRGYASAIKDMTAIFMATFQKIGKKKVDYSISYENKRFGVVKAFDEKTALAALNQKHGQVEAIINNGGMQGDTGEPGIHLYNTVCGVIEKYKTTNKKNKIEIILTDGQDMANDLKYDPSRRPIPSVRLARKLEEAKHAGIEIVGIGFNTRDTEVFGKWVQLNSNQSEAVVEALLKIGRRKALSGKLPAGNLVDALSINLNRKNPNEKAKDSFWEKAGDFMTAKKKDGRMVQGGSGENEAGTLIPDDDEIKQAQEFLAGQGYPEIQIAGWLARGRSKLLEIAQEAGFRPTQEGGEQPRRDGGAEQADGGVGFSFDLDTYPSGELYRQKNIEAYKAQQEVLKEYILKQIRIYGTQLGIGSGRVQGIRVKYEKTGAFKDIFKVIVSLSTKKSFTLCLVILKPNRDDYPDGFRPVSEIWADKFRAEVEIKRTYALEADAEGLPSNLVPALYDTGVSQSGALRYYLQEWIDGPTIAEIMKTGVLKEADLECIAQSWMTIGRVLGKYASDLNAANMMRRQDGSLAVVDLGGISILKPTFNESGIVFLLFNIYGQQDVLPTSKVRGAILAGMKKGLGPKWEGFINSALASDSLPGSYRKSIELFLRDSDQAERAADGGADQKDSRIAAPGGIDLRRLPVRIGTPANVRADMPGDPRLDAQWQDIQDLVNKGFFPGSDRIKEYLSACQNSRRLPVQVGKVIAGAADILRIEEDLYLPTDTSLKELLVLLESG